MCSRASRVSVTWARSSMSSSSCAPARHRARCSVLTSLQPGRPARYLRTDQTLGSVTPGKRADLVLLEANPLEDIDNTERISAVVLGGRFIDRSEIERRLAEVRKAAAATE